MFGKCRESSEVTPNLFGTEKSRFENLTHLTREKLAGIHLHKEPTEKCFSKGFGLIFSLGIIDI